jgi:hypothetical protein
LKTASRTIEKEDVTAHLSPRQRRLGAFEFRAELFNRFNNPSITLPVSSLSICGFWPIRQQLDRAARDSVCGEGEVLIGLLPRA